MPPRIMFRLPATTPQQARTLLRHLRPRPVPPAWSLPATASASWPAPIPIRWRRPYREHRKPRSCLRPLARTSGAGSGILITADDVIWFSDGYGLTGGDEIVVGSNGPVVITGIDYTNNILAVDRSITWNDNDPINRPHAGSAPDLGVFEYGAGGLRIVSARLAAGRAGHYYYSHLDAWEGVRPYAWELTSGSLPAGLKLDARGAVSGVPAAAGDYAFSVAVTDSAGTQASREVALEIRAAAFFSTVLEAEDGTDNGPYEVGSDAGASGGEYIYIPAGTGRTSFPVPEMAYTIQAPASGLYYVWLRMYGLSGGERKTYVFVNADSCRRVNPETYNQYVWARSSAEPFALNYGTNRLELGHGDELVRIDQLLVTQDRYYDPNTTGIPQGRSERPRSGLLNLPNPITNKAQLGNCRVYNLYGQPVDRSEIRKGVYYIMAGGTSFYKRLVLFK